MVSGVNFPEAHITKKSRLAHSICALAMGLLLFVVGGQAGSASAQSDSTSGSWMPKILESRPIMSSDQGTRRAAPYLPDFSYAGYRWGEEPLPSPSGTVIDVREFGAVPNDGTDDTEALRRAVRRAHRVDGPVVVQLPPGRLILKEVLYIQRSRFVLRGGPDARTTLAVSRPLSQMNLPESATTPPKEGYSPFSWRGGVLWTRMEADPSPQRLGKVVAGERGHRVIKVAQATSINPGDVVRINWYNPEGKSGSFLQHMYCSAAADFGRRVVGRTSAPLTMQEVTVAEVRGQLLVLKEPLMHSIQPDWNPRLTTTHFLERVGIEHLRIEFPEDEYAGHHKEAGYNGMFLTDLLHSWVRDVTIANADSGILTDSSKNVTIRDVRTEGRRAHYSVHVAGSYGMLVRDFTFRAPAIHNPSFNTHARRSVYVGGEVHHARLDQHNGYNHQNLFDNLRAHLIPRWNLFRHGGDHDTRPAAGAFNTFWNVRVQLPGETQSAKVGTIENAPRARVIGLHGNGHVEISYGPDLYAEGINRDDLAVPSLYHYQLQKRQNTPKYPSIAVLSPSKVLRVRKETTVTLAAAVSPSQVGVQRVEFYTGDTRIGTAKQGDRTWKTTWSNPPAGISRIRAVAVLEDGSRISSDPPSCGEDPPGVWTGDIEDLVDQPFPMPAQSYTTISYNLPSSQYVQLDLFDLQGRRVRSLVDEFQMSGTKKVMVNTSTLASGMYFYQLQFGNRALTGKITVVH